MKLLNIILFLGPISFSIYSGFNFIFEKKIKNFYAILLDFFLKTNKGRTDKLGMGCFSICLETKIEIWKYCKQDTFYVSLEPFYLLFSIKLN